MTYNFFLSFLISRWKCPRRDCPQSMSIPIFLQKIVDNLLFQVNFHHVIIISDFFYPYTIWLKVQHNNHWLFFHLPFSYGVGWGVNTSAISKKQFSCHWSEMIKYTGSEVKCLGHSNFSLHWSLYFDNMGRPWTCVQYWQHYVKSLYHGTPMDLYTVLTALCYSLYHGTPMDLCTVLTALC